MSIRICLAGATGWVGSALSRAIYESQEFELVAAVGKRSAGKRLGDILGIPKLNVKISATVQDAFSTTCDVFIDYTHPTVVKNNVKEAINRRVGVVIGTSGLTDNEYAEIDELARNHRVGVLASGNFAITAVLLQRFAMIGAKYVPHWEIIDYAHAEKPDAPSGTVRELASKLSEIRSPIINYPIDQTYGKKESRGANIKGTQIHSIRLPSFVFAFEIIFGQSNERLLLRHEAGSGAEPYVAGTLLAAGKVKTFVGLRRGLDTVMEF